MGPDGTLVVGTKLQMTVWRRVVLVLSVGEILAMPLQQLAGLWKVRARTFLCLSLAPLQHGLTWLRRRSSNTTDHQAAQRSAALVLLFLAGQACCVAAPPAQSQSLLPPAAQVRISWISVSAICDNS